MNRFHRFFISPLLVSGLLFLAVSHASFGQLAINAEGVPFTINFDATVPGVNEGQFTGAGFAPIPAAGQINSNAFSITGLSDGDLNFGDTRVDPLTDFTRGTSAVAVTPGGIYAFTVGAGNNALGFQSTDPDMTPGSIVLKVKNSNINNNDANYVEIDYKALYFNDQFRATSLNFSYSLDGISYTNISSLNLATPINPDAPATWISNARSFFLDLSSNPIIAGDFLYLRWNTDDIGGSRLPRDEIAIDDISIVFNPIPDNDSRTFDIGIQPEPNFISSLSNSKKDSTLVFYFAIQDLGSNDDFPTKVKSMRIVPGPENNISWISQIQGVLLQDFGSNSFSITSLLITDEYIDLEFLEDEISITTGLLGFQFFIYLNNTGLEDGKKLQFQIDTDAVGFSTYPGSSEFAPSFPVPITSETHTIDVLTTELRFVIQPEDGLTNIPMSADITIEATDANGNRDLDYATAVDLSSSGSLIDATLTPISSISVTAANGLATWAEATDPIIHSAIGTDLILTGSDGSLTDAISTPFDIIQSADRVAFTSQPVGGQINQNVSSIVVSALKPDLFVDETYQGDITLSINSGPGAISGTLTKLAVDGVATFNDIKFNTLGDYTLLATGQPYMTTAISNNIKIGDFFQDFTNCPATNWVPITIQGNGWVCGSGYASANGLGATGASEAWNISPLISFSTLTDAVLTFDTWTSGTDVSHPRLELLYSTNYSGSGNPYLADWTSIDFSPSPENAGVWTPSGIIDLSTITTDGRLAFRYTSSGSTDGTATEWRIDNVLITQEGCVAPDVQASNLTFPEIQDNQMTLNWDNGDGAGRIVVAKAGSPVDQDPANGEDYTANADFALGDNINGTGNIVVYKGTGNSVTVTNLLANSTYHFAVYEYNCNAANTTFNLASPATGSQITNASNIIAQADYVYSELTDYPGFAGLTNLTDPVNSRGVFGLTIQDGGSTLLTDGLATILTSITFNTNGSNAIRAAVLFDDANTFIAEKTVNGTGEFTIDGFSYSVPDGTSRNFELRVTFEDGVVDNQQIVLTVAEAMSDPSGTIFSDLDAGGAQSSSLGTDNTISVVADQLIFVQVPLQTIPVDQAFIIEVEAVDSRSSRDLDKTLTISKTTGTGNLTTASGASLSTATGTALWNDLIYDTEETGVVFTIDDGGALSISTDPLDAKFTFSIFTFTGAVGIEPTFPADNQPMNVTVSDISRGVNVSPTSLADAFNSSNWPTLGLDYDSYYEVTITANPGHEFNLTGIQLDHRSTATGPADWEVRSSINNFGSNIGGFFEATQDGTWSRNTVVDFGTTIENQTAVTLRIYAYNAGGGGGTFAIDNLIIFGSSVDVAAPIFTATPEYPLYDSVAVDGFDLLVNLDEPATVYYVVQDPIISAPNATQVIAGLNGSGSSAIATDTITVKNQAIEFRERVRGLSSDFSYIVYYVLYDSTNYSNVILQSPVRTSDTNTNLSTATQPAGSTISSLADSVQEAVQVFSFNIADAGTADGAPTHVTRLVFEVGAGNTVADWTTTIAGATLYNDTKATPIPVSAVIAEATITLDIALGDLTIDDGVSEQITLSVWLTNSVIDNEALAFTIGGTGHSNTSYSIGSQLAGTLVDLTSNPYTIEVLGERLLFDAVPVSVSTSTEFGLNVLAVDANGNIDLDNNTTVDLARGLGTGVLTSMTSTSSTMVNGVASWTDLLYDGVDEFFTLIASDNAVISPLSSDTTSVIEAGSATDLIVPNGNLVTISTDQTFDDVNVELGGTLRLNSGINLTIGGNLTLDGTFTDLGGTTNFNGIATQSISSADINRTDVFYNITVSNTIGLVSEIHINLTNTLKINANASIDVDGTNNTRNFTLVSSPTMTARIDKIEDGGRLDGNIVWQRSLRTGPAGWRYIGMPIIGQTLSNINDDVWIQGVTGRYPTAWTNIATYNENLGTNGALGLDGWVDFEALTDDVPVATGMKLWLWAGEYATEQVIVNKGLPIIGDGGDNVADTGEEYSFPISFVSTSYDGGGWNFFANPYPCELDWDLVTKVDIRGVPEGDLSGGAVYIWNPNTQNYGTYSSLSGGVGGVSRYVASGQGFFVKANSGTSTLSVSESSKSTASGNSFLRKSTDPIAKLFVKIKSAQGKEDETAVVFSKRATDDYDLLYDAIKLSGGYVNLSTLAGDKLVAINAMGESRGVQAVKLNVDPYQYGNYTMTFPQLEDMPEGALVRLKDKFLDKTIMVNAASTYGFNIEQNNKQTFGADRFELQFVSPVSFSFDQVSIRSGQEFVMPILADQLADVTNTQLGLGWDVTALEFVGVEDSGDASMDAFDLSAVAMGKLVFDHSSTSPVDLPDGSQLFSLRFRAKNGQRETQLRFDKNATLIKSNDIKMPFFTKDISIDILQNRFIAGKVQTHSGSPIYGVEVKATAADELLANLTGATGEYSLDTYEASGYTISATKIDDMPLNKFVTTLDIIKTRRHLLQMEEFNSPYEVIAADVDGSKTITAIDLVEMRKVILGISEQFRSGYNWLFIPESIDLTSNPFDFVTSLDVSLEDQDLNLDFKGVKVGDVNNSWESQSAGRTNKESMALNLDHIRLENDLIKIPVVVKDFHDISGYQFSITWDAGQLAYVGTSQQVLDGYFNELLAGDGILTSMWDESKGEASSLDDGSVLFVLEFRALDQDANTVIELNSQVTEAVAFDSRLNQMSISSKQANVNLDALRNGKLELFQNVPNPFSSATIVKFKIAKEGLAQFTVMNMLGEIIYADERVYDAGIHEIDWNRNKATRSIAPGVYLYKLSSNGEERVKKMLLE